MPGSSATVVAARATMSQLATHISATPLVKAPIVAPVACIWLKPNRSAAAMQNLFSSTHINRRELMAAAGAAALLLPRDGISAQAAAGGQFVFTHSTVVSVNAVHEDVALAVDGDSIAAIGPSDEISARYPRASVFDGRGKAILPGLINCHAHLAATLGRGFNEDFGFPNSAHLTVSPESLLQGEEQALMVTIGALECIRSGTTTVVEFASNIASYASALAQS